jgi:thiol-disulfide isomerase/thioredoxin
MMGMDALYVEMAKYYLNGKAPWASDDFLARLRESIPLAEKVLIGKPMPEINFDLIPGYGKVYINGNTKESHVFNKTGKQQLDADYTIVVFWNPECSKCMHPIAEINKLASNTPKLKINKVAVSTTFLSGGDIKEIQWKGLSEWANTHVNSVDWQSDKYKVFGIDRVPTIYILDKDFRIIAKKLSASAIEQFIQYHQKQ